MFGVKSSGMAPAARFWRIFGSLKNWRVPISANTRISTRARLRSGILIRRAICHWEAPSMRAASYSSGSMPWRAAYRMIM